MKLELTNQQAHDLYDMLYMIESGDIKINNLQESYNEIFNMLEEYCVPELNANLAESVNHSQQEDSKTNNFSLLTVPADTNDSIEKELNKDYAKDEVSEQ
jgi:hypothetical protein